MATNESNVSKAGTAWSGKPVVAGAEGRALDPVPAGAGLHRPERGGDPLPGTNDGRWFVPPVVAAERVPPQPAPRGVWAESVREAACRRSTPERDPRKAS